AAPPDLTLRAVLARWARAAGWTFEAEHWALDVDIPLAGKAELPGDFKTAVRALLAATELSERPAQPCFYANRVLRVVPLAQAWGLSLALGGCSLSQQMQAMRDAATSLRARLLEGQQAVGRAGERPAREAAQDVAR
ncbi:toxin co-regulated pilus biosynthesis Q family protein, partial [Bordetella pertussis]|uniref:toxin co-regulated pilus biosynthesis Q family protein n=1 Tax=Bordetella pertussis TaxID=520 RepID=UPI0021CCEA26